MKKEYPYPYFSDEKIREMIFKVASVRSLPWEHFTKQLEKLIVQCYEKGYNDGKDFMSDCYYN